MRLLIFDAKVIREYSLFLQVSMIYKTKCFSVPGVMFMFTVSILDKFKLFYEVLLH